MAGGPLGAAGSGREAGIWDGTGDLPDQVAGMDINVRINARVMARIGRLKATSRQTMDYQAGLRTSKMGRRVDRRLMHGHSHPARALALSLCCWLYVRAQDFEAPPENSRRKLLRPMLLIVRSRQGF